MQTFFVQGLVITVEGSREMKDERVLTEIANILLTTTVMNGRFFLFELLLLCSH